VRDTHFGRARAYAETRQRERANLVPFFKEIVNVIRVVPIGRLELTDARSTPALSSKTITSKLHNGRRHGERHPTSTRVANSRCVPAQINARMCFSIVQPSLRSKLLGIGPNLPLDAAWATSVGVGLST